MRKAISAAFAAMLLCGGIASANAPTVADLDAHSRASGNRTDVAVAVGERLFRTMWPVQLVQVSANAVADSASQPGAVVVGLRLSGVKFHAPVTRAAYIGEIASLVQQTFAASAGIEEVDAWTAVPIAVKKGIIVSGDLAQPTTRNVFTVSVRRGESAAALAARLRAGRDAFWDASWAQTAFKGGS